MLSRCCPRLRRLRFPAGVVLAGLLTACGAGTVKLAGDSGTPGRALPLIGWYYTALQGYGSQAWLDFRLDRAGLAEGVLRVQGANLSLPLTGQVGGDRVLRLSGSLLTVEGEFSGAVNPLDVTEYYSSGVYFRGRWQTAGGRFGLVEGFHDSWPPRPSSSGSWNSGDSWSPIDFGSPGGSTGGGPSGGDPPATGFDPPPGGSEPPASGGDTTDVDIIWRANP